MKKKKKKNGAANRAAGNRLQRVLWKFDKIARDNGGNRAFGTPGYRASVDFVLERTQRRFGKEMDTHLHRFSYWFEELRQIKATGLDGEGVRVLSPQYNVAGDLRAVPLIDTPVGDVSGSSCLPGAVGGHRRKRARSRSSSGAPVPCPRS